MADNRVADGAYDSKANKTKDLSRKVTKKEMSIVDLPDENLPKSVGARWANEEIKMPEYKNSANGSGVHEESKMLLDKAQEYFTKGSMKGTNIVYPFIGDDSKKL